MEKEKNNFPFKAFLLVSVLVALPFIGGQICGTQDNAKNDTQSSFSSTQQISTTTNIVSEFIPPSQSSKYIGKTVTVCGDVVDSFYAISSAGKPTFLNFEYPYPMNSFVVVIWGDDRSKFPPVPENYFLNKRVCANGLIETYQGTPQIVAEQFNQLFLGE